MSQISKLMLTALLSAAVVGSVVYLLLTQNNQLAAKPSLISIAENSDNELVYLVTAPKIGGETKMILKDWDLLFSLQYNYTPWGELRYTKTDLTASGGAPANSFDAMVSYNFCAGEHYCFLDEKEGSQEGLGFNITVWNAHFSGKAQNPNFYLKNGGTLLKQTDKYIVTYKPFPGMTPADVAQLKNVMSTFELKSFTK